MLHPEDLLQAQAEVAQETCPLSFNTPMAQRAEAGCFDSTDAAPQGPAGGGLAAGREAEAAPQTKELRRQGNSSSTLLCHQHRAAPCCPAGLQLVAASSAWLRKSRAVPSRQGTLTLPPALCLLGDPHCSFAHCPSPAAIGARRPSSTQPRQPGACQEQGTEKETARDSAELCWEMRLNTELSWRQAAEEGLKAQEAACTETRKNSQVFVFFSNSLYQK